MTSLLQQRWFIYAGMLLFGTTTAIFSKIQLDMKAKGWRDCGVHKFSKPWFENPQMFSAMIGCLFFFWLMRIWRFVTELQRPKLKEKRLAETPNVKVLQVIKGYFVIAIPAIFDLVGSGVMTMGLLFTTISVMQMLRGSMVLFSAFLSVIFLRRKLRVYNWVAVCVVIAGLVLVGIAAVQSGQGSSSFADGILGCILVIGSQFIQAGQIVVEEHFLKNIMLPPLLIVGMEGFWGLLISIVIVCPLIYAIPGSDCLGRYENTIDTLVMVSNSGALFGIILAFMVSCLFYNFFGMMVTFSQSAVHRTIMEAVRTACIWVVDLMIYYFIDERYGEYWDRWGWMQLAGFALLIVAMSIYNEALHLPYLHYPTQAELDAEAAKKEEKRKRKEEKRLAKKRPKYRGPVEPGVPVETPEGSLDDGAAGDLLFLDSPAVLQ